MKLRFVFAALFFFLVSLSARAQCTNFTPNVGFGLPIIGATSAWGTCINTNFTILDTLLGGYGTFSPNAATPSVANYKNWVTANTIATVITNFTGGYPGQQINMFCDDMNTTMTSGVNFSLSASFSCSTADSISLVLRGSIWYEVGRGQVSGNIPGGSQYDVQTNSGSSTFASGVANRANVGVLGNIARKPAIGDAIQYVSLTGADTNDGFSWGTAKLTVMAAYDALPSTGGTIFYSSGVYATTTGQGIFLMGPNDPNYSSPPTGWRVVKPVRFTGVGCDNYNQQAHMCTTAIVLGEGAGTTGIWLSSFNNNVVFENMFYEYPSVEAKIGIDSNGSQTALSGVIGATFNNMVTFGCNSCSGSASPGWYIGGGDTFDIIIRDSVIQGNPFATPGSDNQASILIKPTSATGDSVGFLSISDSEMTGGGIKAYSGNITFDNLYISNVYSEGLNGGSVIPAVGTVTFAGGGLRVATLTGVTMADGIGNVADVVNLLPTSQSFITIVGGSDLVYGPATVNQIDWYGDTAVSITPYSQQQTGFVNGRVYGLVDSPLRSFSPVSVRWPNLATTNSASWTATGGTLTIGITAPDGTTGAGQLTSSSGRQSVTFYSASHTIAVGDAVIGGFWIRSSTSNGYVGGVNPVQGYSGSNTFSCYSIQPPVAGDGEWEWWVEMCIATAISVSPDNFSVSAFANPTNAVQFYAPIFVYIPNGTASNNELHAILNALKPYDSSCSVGSVCGLRGQGGTQVGIDTMVSGTKTVTFAERYASKPVCVANDETSIAAVQVTPSASTLVLTTSGLTDVVDWNCKGNPN